MIFWLVASIVIQAALWTDQKLPFLVAKGVASSPAQAPSPQLKAPVAVLSSAEAHARISTLNREHRFKAPLFGQVDLTRLQPENCFGVDLGGDTRLVGESSPGAGLSFLRQGKEPMTAVGVASIEGNLRIGTVLVPRGEYVVFAGPGVLSFATDPVDHTVDVPLARAIPESRLGRHAPDMPRMALAIEDGKASLVIAGNNLPIERVR